MPSVQSVYTSLSIISLGALIGMGVAVGSGVSMMSMAMYEEEEKNKMTASSVVEQSFRPAGRGFAASGSK
jgi:predicted RND superfamily exporter protein